jgi:predicted SAM-dependent methyltransferase/dTDP-4-dehydrorhamnose 3,5-epimerase-like enzyme
MKLESKQNSINNVKLISLSKNEGIEGTLIVAQHEEHIPFKTERVFFVKANSDNTIRGNHAHKSLSQFMICINGEIEITVDDSKEKKKYILNSSSQGLLVPSDIFCWQKYVTNNSILMVMCDQPYDELDYIRDYNLFKEYINKKSLILQSNEVKLNLGCGGRPLDNFINVDMDSLEQIKKRYPNRVYSDDIMVVNYDLFNLPFDNNSVDEIRSEALIEHLPFVDEPKFFNEVYRVLKPGGSLYLTTVDFEKACQKWLDSKDNWLDFYRNDNEAIHEEHWFGNYSYNANNRWGYLTATFYGSQNGLGQFHTNCYSEGKFRAICHKLGLEVVKIDRFNWQGDRDDMIALTAKKPL